jgi:protein tyrosine/serine phosphatase
MASRTALLRTALALVIAISSALPAAARTSNDGKGANTSTAASNVRIENFGQVSATYFRGAQPSGRDYADLAALGVKTIIDLQEADGDPSERSLARAAGIEYHRIPMSTHRPPTAEQLALFFKLASDPTKPVYVHCKGGRHRTGVMTAAYRMSYDGWTPDKAFAEMKKYDFGPDFLHPEFKKYVYGYDVSRVPTTAVAAATQQ